MSIFREIKSKWWGRGWFGVLVLVLLLGLPGGQARAEVTLGTIGTGLGDSVIPGGGFFRLISGISPSGVAADAVVESATDGVIDDVSTWTTRFLAEVLDLVVQVGVWLLQLVSELLGRVVLVGDFVTSPFVTTGWPFVQGLANFGFILALLVIALTTALRVDFGGGARRLLPRLLLGALLINFSLLIGGLIIDFSRLLMALFANLVSGDVTELGPDIISKSEIIKSLYTINTSDFFSVTQKYKTEDITRETRLSTLIGLVQAIIFVWGLALGMLFIAVTLVIRYILLLLLLTVSPVVYVAIAFPNGAGLARKWWSTFLTNVFYGPIAMFALVMLSTAGPGAGKFGSLGRVTEGFLGLIITVIMLVLVSTSGKKWGAFGASAAISGTKGVGNFVRRNPKTTVAALGLASGGVVPALLAGAGALAAQRGGQSVARNARDFGKGVSGGLIKSARGGQFGGAIQGLLGPERDEKGNLKKGQSSFGSRLADRAPTSPKTRAERALGAQASQAIGSDATKVVGAISNPEDLSKPNVASAITPQTYEVILSNSDANGERHKQELIAGTLQQGEISEEHARTLNEYLTVTIKDETDNVRDARNDEQQAKNEARQAQQDHGAGSTQALAAQQRANDARQEREAAEKRLNLAKGQLKEAVGKKQYVDQLGQKEKSDIGLLNESDISSALRNTLNKKDDE